MARQLIAALLVSLASLPASSQIFRAYLSIDGSDANPCTLPSPCRLLPAALAAVADGGEIWMLDSANYNTAPVDVNKSVTILAVPGTLGSVVALGGNAMNVAGPGINVALRNLNILPFPGNEAYRGISMASGTSLSLQGCDVSGFSAGVGLHVASLVRVQVVDSTFRRNNFGIAFVNGPRAVVTGSRFLGGGVAISVETDTATRTQLAIERSVAADNGGGFQALAFVASASSYVSVVDSTMSGQTNSGASASTFNASAIAEVSVYGSQVTGNLNGLRSSGTGARMIAGGNLVAHNTTGLRQDSGFFGSAGNNVVQGNDTASFGTISLVGTN